MRERMLLVRRRLLALALAVVMLFGLAAVPWGGNAFAFAAHAEEAALPEEAGTAPEAEVPADADASDLEETAQAEAPVDADAVPPLAEPAETEGEAEQGAGADASDATEPAAAPASGQDALTVGSTGNVNAGDHPATTAGLQAAVDAINSGGTITLMTGVGLDAPIAVPAGKSVTITCGNNLGPEYARITSMYGNDPKYAGDMFVVNAGAHLVLKGLTVHGNNQVQGQARVLVRVDNGSFTMENTELDYAHNTPNTNTDNSMILAEGANATVTLKNAVVDIAVYTGITLNNGASLFMHEGSQITRCKGTGVVARNGSAITLYGGSIVQNGENLTYHTNKTAQQGGGVLLDGSTLNIQGGAIEKNRATYGNGVYATNGSTITLAGGSISGNGKVLANNLLQGAQQGGGILLDGSTLNMQGGSITGNSAAKGGGVFATNNATITAAGGQIGVNNADNGVYMDGYLPVQISAAGMAAGTRVNIEDQRGADGNVVVGVTANGRAATAEDAAAFSWRYGSAMYYGIAQDDKVVIQVPTVTSVRLSQKSVTIVKGSTFKPTAIAYTAAGTKAAITWASSNTKVATVDKNGTIRAIKKGTAKITASAGTKSATITVKVVNKKPAANSVKTIKVSGMPKTIKVGAKKAISVTYSPSTVVGVSVSYKSSKPSVLSVDKTGMLTAKKAGKATITVKVGGVSKSYTITVKKA